MVVAAGETFTLPADTFCCAPNPGSIVSDVALVVVQLSVEELPLEIAAGAAANVRVGGGGGCGEGGGALGVDEAAGAAGC